MVAIYKVEAFVIRRTEILHKDIVVTLFAKEFGKVRAIAKGVKKLTSRRAPHLQTANLLIATLQQRHEVYYVNQTQLISGFAQLKEDPLKLNFIYVLFFILDRLLPENQPEERVYRITKNFVVVVSKSAHPKIAILSECVYKILQILGYLHDAPLTFGEVIQTTEEIIHEKIPTNIL